MAELKTDPKLKDFQEYVQKGAEELGFDKLNASQRCLMLGEEVGELFKSVRKHEKIVVDTNTGAIEEELADVFLQVCAVANFFNIDLEKAFREKQEKDKGRWQNK
jgi:NTP pyrophosphatase (non-canonical NTP hydrolase)